MAAERKMEDYYPRAPRYVIELGDNEVVRFAQGPKGSQLMHSRIIDLSESGMAFIVPLANAPKMGDAIKVEFTAPLTESIACFAEVVRVQNHRTYNKRQRPVNFKLIAVQFQNLHPKQRKMLSDGLLKQMKQKLKEYKRDQAWNQFVWFWIDLGTHLKKWVSNSIRFITQKFNKKSDQSKDIKPFDQ